MSTKNSFRSNRSNIVFVGGIHGVGKGRLCRVLGEHLGWAHLSAGKLIAAAENEPERLDKRVADAVSNQERLLRVLSATMSPGIRYLLDGHFCLLTPNLSFTPTPFHVFERISPEAILLLKEKPAVIAQRLQIRDGRSHPDDFLRAFQAEEISLATMTAERLNVPFLEASPENYEEILEFCKSSPFH
jgi:adenylate kinase